MEHLIDIWSKSKDGKFNIVGKITIDEGDIALLATERWGMNHDLNPDLQYFAEIDKTTI